MRQLALLLLAVLLISACRGGAKQDAIRSYEHTAPKTTIALVVAEWNKVPLITASAFLVNRESGAFITAKHFTDELSSLGAEKCTLFFNGRVYDARVAAISPLQDAVIIQISGNFDREQFPEPPKLAPKKVSRGEAVFIEGIHAHPFFVREANESDGRPDTVIRIYGGYYKIDMRDKTREAEVVLDRLPGKIVRVVENLPINVEKNKWNELRQKANRFFEIKTDFNHRFSFGGLSGGLATNKRGEVIGIVTAELPMRIEFDDKGLLIEKPNLKAVADTLYITPVENIKDLYEQAQKIGPPR